MIALVPLCVCVAVGLDLPALRRRCSAPLVHTAIVTWALLAFAALWIDAESPHAMTARGMRAAAAGEPTAAAAQLAHAAAQAPHDWLPRLALAELLIGQQASPEVVQPWLELADGRLDLASRHFLLASVLRRHGRPDEALNQARQGIALDPDSPVLYAIAADVLAAQGDREGAVRAWREALRLSPHSRTAHASLAGLLDQLGHLGVPSQHERGGAGGTRLRTTNLRPPLVDQMRAARALLRDVEALVHEDGMTPASSDAVGAAGAGADAGARSIDPAHVRGAQGRVGNRQGGTQVHGITALFHGEPRSP